MHQELKQYLIYIWKHEIGPAYHEGRLANLMALEAEWYRHLYTWGGGDYEIWIEPKLDFVPQAGIVFDDLEGFRLRKWLLGQQLSLILTQYSEVICVIQLNFSPGDYAVFRREMRRLVSLFLLEGETQLKLRKDPHTGKIDESSFFTLSPGVLYVYGVITRKGSFALEQSTLVKEFDTGHLPAHFLHLKGAVKADKIVFSHSINK